MEMQPNPFRKYWMQIAHAYKNNLSIEVKSGISGPKQAEKPDT